MPMITSVFMTWDGCCDAPKADMEFVARIPFSLYPIARQSANRTDIKITTIPVAKTSRSANKRRI
jgi:hypothetical protein